LRFKPPVAALAEAEAAQVAAFDRRNERGMAHGKAARRGAERDVLALMRGNSVIAHTDGIGRASDSGSVSREP